jgi:hypothetical protein
MRSRSIRLFAVAIAAGSLIAVPLAESGSAATPVSCAAAKTVNNLKTFTNTATMSKCTNVPATGGKGVMVTNFKNLKKITAKVTWNKTGTTTLAITQKKATSAQIAKCVKTVGKGASAASSTGTVTGGTGKALKAIPKGSKFSETVCYSSKSVVTLYPGSKIVF